MNDWSKKINDISSSCESSITRVDIQKVFIFLTQVYGHAFVSNYGERDDGIWFSTLRELKRDEIKAGIEYLKKGDNNFVKKPYPPNVIQFKSICKEAYAIKAPSIQELLPPPKYKKANSVIAAKYLSKMYDTLDKSKVKKENRRGLC